MNDITFAEMIEAVKDESLKTWLEKIGAFPEDFTMCEFMMKIIEACSIAAKIKNESLEEGAKILAYSTVTNSTVEVSKNNNLFFRSTMSVNSLVVVDFDAAQALNG